MDHIKWKRRACWRIEALVELDRHIHLCVEGLALILCNVCFSLDLSVP